MSRETMSTEPEALRLADALDAEFVQGRISNHNGRKAAVELRRLALKQWVGLTDEEIDALSQARSLTDELMDCVDRLGSEADTVDPRVWQHLLVYAPKPEEEPVAWISEGGDVSRSKRYMDEMGFKCNPLYTSPQKQWVGLTDEEIVAATNTVHGFGVIKQRDMNFARSVEAKLKEKNHG